MCKKDIRLGALQQFYNIGRGTSMYAKIVFYTNFLHDLFHQYSYLRKSTVPFAAVAIFLQAQLSVMRH